jgi:hypothetical protein
LLETYLKSTYITLKIQNKVSSLLSSSIYCTNLFRSGISLPNNYFILNFRFRHKFIYIYIYIYKYKLFSFFIKLKNMNMFFITNVLHKCFASQFKTILLSLLSPTTKISQPCCP